MNISEVSKIGNKIVAFCTGEDIPFDTKVNAIETSSGKRYDVDEYDSNISFSNEKVALISFRGIKNENEMPMGEVKIITS